MPDPDAARPKKGHYLLKATTAVLLLAIAYKYTTDAKAVSEAAAAASAVTLPSTVSTRISWDNGGQGGLGIAGGIGDISAVRVRGLQLSWCTTSAQPSTRTFYWITFDKDFFMVFANVTFICTFFNTFFHQKLNIQLDGRQRCPT